jgi:hypothetical protein
MQLYFEFHELFRNIGCFHTELATDPYLGFFKARFTSTVGLSLLAPLNARFEKS